MEKGAESFDPETVPTAARGITLATSRAHRQESYFSSRKQGAFRERASLPDAGKVVLRIIVETSRFLVK